MKILDIIALVIVFAVLFAVGIKAIQEANETADVIACRTNQHTLVQGIIQYEEAKGYLPPLTVLSSSLPGWNTRILPYIGHASIHEALVTKGIYTIDPRFGQQNDVRNDMWGACFDMLATVSEYRCPVRQPEPVIKHNKWAGPTTDYVTPLIWTNYKERFVTTRRSNFDRESPLIIHEINSHKNTWWVTRKSSDWMSGKSGTLLISEKYIPDWAVNEDSEEANIFNGGLQVVSVTQPERSKQYGRVYVPQSVAVCYMASTRPIVKDGETPITKETEYHSRRVTALGPQQNYRWHGDYAWGSSHTGVIVAAMGDGSVRTVNKNINALTFYQLTSSNTLPAPTQEECPLSEEEYRSMLLQDAEERANENL